MIKREVNLRKYEKEYSEKKFWDKVKKHAKAIGRDTLEKALILFYALKDPDTPAWAKGVIIGALGYLILPTDMIPDFLPGAGFSDDAVSIATALLTIAGSIKEEHKRKAREKVANLLGE